VGDILYCQFENMNSELINKLPITVISTFGHNGIDWLHSLLDDHPEVLIMPGFSFFRTLEMFQKEAKIGSLKDLNDELMAQKLTRFFIRNSAYKTIRRKFLNGSVEEDLFNKELHHYLESNNSQIPLVKLFFGIHYAFAMAKKIDIRRKTIIVVQEHVPWYSEKYENIFSPRFVFMMRDPRAALAGSWIRLTHGEENKKLHPYRFDHTILYWLYPLRFLKNYEKFIGFRNRFKIMKNEKMHGNLKDEMRQLCQWLGIAFNTSCLEQTFLGVGWHGESVYLAPDELQQAPPADYYEEEKIEKRWRGALDVRQIRMIEYLLPEIFEKFNYPTDYKKNKLIYFYCMMQFVFLNQLNIRKRNRLIMIVEVLRNVSRRMSILFFPLHVRNIFKIL
jgi:hypothetical protein